MQPSSLKVHIAIACALVAVTACRPAADENVSAGADEFGDNVVVSEVPPVDELPKDETFDDYEAFKATVYKEPFAGGGYIVNGDTFIPDEEELRRFYSEVVALKFQGDSSTAIVIDAPGGNVAGWKDGRQRNLTYCVSRSFGQNHAAVVSAMRSAASAWEADADVRFVHLAQEDGRCVPANGGIMFDVRPVDVGGRYLARAFFPRYGRPDRNLLIDASSFALDPRDKLQLVGVLRHELGHTLGFRHEQTRPEAGKCFEDSNWKPLTDYDAYSVMHYPQCNGLGDWSLNLTDSDRLGAVCFYGKAATSQFDVQRCQPLRARLQAPAPGPSR